MFYLFIWLQQVLVAAPGSFAAAHESSHEIFVTSPGNFSMAGVDLHTGFLLHLVGTSLRCLGIFLDAPGASF